MLSARNQLRRIGTQAGCDAISELREFRKVSHDCSVFRERVGKEQCVTIASNEAKGIGEKCDKEEVAAMKTNRPLVEKEKENGKEVYDVTIPIHDNKGKIIAMAGMDFKPEPGQTNVQITERSLQIAKEVEARVKTKEKLFEPIS
jgi:hypothetical protein